MMNLLKIIALITGLTLGACSVESSPQAGNQTEVSTPVINPRHDTELQKQIAEIAKEAKGKVGVYATVIETGQSVSLNPNEKFAMQSVVKLPISMAVMKRVAEGKLTLDQKVKIAKDEFVPSNMRSPIREANPNGAELTVEELLRAAISVSDGTAADVLQRVAGGATGIQAYVDSLGIADMKIKHSHKEFGQKWEFQYENSVAPTAAVALLTKLWNATGGKASVNERLEGTGARGAELLMKFMTESDNPPNRLKGMLPKGTVVAHKTGTGGTQNGITSATNDVGIITLPNGSHVAIAVFVGDSTADLAVREAVIAKIARAVFDKWSQPVSTEPAKVANFTERHTLN